MQRERTLRIDLAAAMLLIVTVFLLLSLGTYDPADAPSGLVYRTNAQPSNLCGLYGARAAHVLLNVFGVGAYVLAAGCCILTVLLFARISLRDIALRSIGVGMSLWGLCVLAAKFLPNWNGGFLPAIGAGGYVGATGLTLLEWHLSIVGVWLVLLSVLVVGTLLAGDELLLRFAAAPGLIPLAVLRRAGAGFAPARVFTRFRGTKGGTAIQGTPPEMAEQEEIESLDEQDDEHSEAEQQSSDTPQEEIRVNTPTNRPVAKPAAQDVMAVLEAASQGQLNGDYELPPLDLLEPAEEFPYELHEKQVRRKALILEKTFRDFGYDVKVVEIDTGPVITQYEIELEAGLRLSKIMSLADDVAIALRVASVRIVAPIPGKNTVGVEVPNDRRALVRLREVIESAPTGKMRIPFFMGKDVGGTPVVCDLADMPHLLIAGRTGTGKSVSLNAMILSILMTRAPRSVRMLMIDPKMVELAPYRRVPHLMHPVVTDMKKAEAILAWAVDKMEERYDLLARTGVRHIDTYNQLGEDEIFDRLGPMDEHERARVPIELPYIVIIGDEIADLMMTAPKEVEAHIIRLAQKSRAVGIHLVLATQKPTVDVITGLIKSNLPARICFQVASRTDSRVVLDEIGAEKLLSGGDMLYLLPGTSTLIRAQGTFVNDREVNGVVDFLGTSEPQYSKELVQLKPTPSDDAAPGSLRHRDELYEAAVEIVLREGRGSVSLLQRTLGIGYGRAARLIDFMAEDGLVGEYNGSQAREVLLTPEQWRAISSGEELSEQGNPASAAHRPEEEEEYEEEEYEEEGEPYEDEEFAEEEELKDQ